MKRIILTVLATVAILFAGSSPAFAAYPTGPDANKASNWNNQFAHPATCYKHGAGVINGHGTFSEDGKTFTLATFNPKWPGDHWEAIIVKAGSKSSVGNPNLVFVHPTAGTAYAARSGKDISHVIVCKGVTPSPSTSSNPQPTASPSPSLTDAPSPTRTPGRTASPTPTTRPSPSVSPTPIPSSTPSYPPSSAGPSSTPSPVAPSQTLPPTDTE